VALENIKFSTVIFRVRLLFIGGAGAIIAFILLLNWWSIGFIENNPADIEGVIDRTSAVSYGIVVIVLITALVVSTLTIRSLKRYTGKFSTQAIQLQTTTDRLERFFQNSSDFIYELDENSKYIYVNQTVEKVIGYSIEELRQRSCWEFVPKEYLESTKKYYIDVIRKKEKSGYHEFPIVDKNGGIIWLGQSVDYVYEGDRAVRAYTIAKNITDQKIAGTQKDKHRKGLRLLNELGAKNSNNHLELLSQGLSLCTEFLDLDLGIVSNVEGDTYTIVDFVPDGAGLERGQTFELGGTYCDITLKAEKTISIDEMSTSKHKAHPCYGNFNLESYIGASYSVNGKVQGTVNFTSQEAHEKPFTEYDIDFVTLVARWVGTIIENHETRKAIKEEQSILEAFVSSAPAAIAMFDTDMKYLAASQKWYTEYSIDKDLKGVSQYEVLPGSIDRKTIHQRALKGEVVGNEEERFELKDGRVIWVKWETRPWYNSKKEIGGVITYTDDITTFKLQKEELEKAKEEAEISGRIKAQFLSTMSHEIRTPLNAIIGTSNLLELEHPELAGNDRMRMLKFGSSNLLSLINDVLDFQKIESGNLKINQSDINLKELVTNISDSWRAVSSDRNISLILSYHSTLSEFYIGDDVRLSQILNNLISNSLKFTEIGSVGLRISCPEEGMIRFEIKDSGIGMPEDKLETIFESFKQIENEHTAKRGGTGLGLSISKKLVSLMGGNLEVASKMGIGSTFSFTIPMKKSIEQTKEIAPSSIMKKMDLTALLVEDNSVNQAIATSFLDRWGIKVKVANNGLEALEKVVDQSFDFILMDMRMPVMDGYEASKQIRLMEGDYFSKVPIIALTASSLLDEKKKIKECGINSLISKPFNPKDLFDEIVKVTSSDLHESQESNDIGSFKFLSQFFGDDLDQIHKVVDTSILSLEKALEILRTGLDRKDKELIYEGVHILRPNLAYVDLDYFADRIPHPDSGDFWIKLPALLLDIQEELEKLKSDFAMK
jgi:PAS domain S-box-containing protein